MTFEKNKNSIKKKKENHSRHYLKKKFFFSSHLVAPAVEPFPGLPKT